MFTYECYCEAFPVRNQVCDFWEVLVTQGLAVGKKWWFLAPELSWVFADRWKFRVLLHSGHFFIPPILKTLSRQEMFTASVRAEVSPASGFIICHVCTGLVAVTECDPSVLPSQAPLGFRESWAHEGPMVLMEF